MSDTRQIIERCLLRVAENVAKHTIQRGGWSATDPCFVIDLRSAESELVQLVEGERGRCAQLLESLFPKTTGSGWLVNDMNREVAMRCAQAIREQG